jgi:hypothetical protein
MKMTNPRHRNANKWDTNRKPSPDFELNKRQKLILEYIWDFGILTENNLMWLENISKRRTHQLTRPLFDNGYINRPKPKVRARYDFMFWCLTKEGAKIVASRQNISVKDLDWIKAPKWGQIEHDALINEFRIILLSACARHDDLQIVDWIGETTFRSWQDTAEYITLAGNAGKRRFAVDCYIKIRRETENPEKPSYFRLLPEIELSSKSNPRFVDQKILPSLAYLKSDIFYKRLGSKSGRYLFIVDSKRKLDNYRSSTARAIDPKDYRNFYFATFDDISVDNVLFEPIWWRPTDKQPVPLFK